MSVSISSCSGSEPSSGVCQACTAQPSKQTSKQKAALVICQEEVDDPPWAAVQHRLPAPWENPDMHIP